MNPIHISKPYFHKIHLDVVTHLCLGLPSGLIPSGLPTKMLYAPLTSPMRATCPTHLILLALITLTIPHYTYLKKSNSIKIGYHVKYLQKKMFIPYRIAGVFFNGS
jgi:hypothetical protein